MRKLIYEPRSKIKTDTGLAVARRHLPSGIVAQRPEKRSTRPLRAILLFFLSTRETFYNSLTIPVTYIHIYVPYIYIYVERRVELREAGS